MVLHTALSWQQQNMDQILNSQNTPHSSPSRASYGVSLASILVELDPVITAPLCTSVNASFAYSYMSMCIQLMLSLQNKVWFLWVLLLCSVSICFLHFLLCSVSLLLVLCVYLIWENVCELCFQSCVVRLGCINGVLKYDNLLALFL